MTKRTYAATPRGPFAVRGVTYASVDECSKALEVRKDWVRRNLRRGTPDRIGLRTQYEPPVMAIREVKPRKPAPEKERNGKPFNIGPYEFDSRRQASRAIGMGPDYITACLLRGSESGLRALASHMAEYVRKREAGGPVIVEKHRSYAANPNRKERRMRIANTAKEEARIMGLFWHRTRKKIVPRSRDEIAQAFPKINVHLVLRRLIERGLIISYGRDCDLCYDATDEGAQLVRNMVEKAQ